MGNTMISYHRGDATIPDIDGPLAIAHICNDAGLFNAGFAKAVARRYPSARRSYWQWHDSPSRIHRRPMALGSIQWVPVGRDIGCDPSDRWVVNMIAQHGVRGKDNPKPLDLRALEACLRNLGQASYLAQADIPVVMPRIGTGFAGGTWDEIEPLIEQHLVDQDVRVYDP